MRLPQTLEVSADFRTSDSETEMLSKTLAVSLGCPGKEKRKKRGNPEPPQNSALGSPSLSKSK